MASIFRSTSWLFLSQIIGRFLGFIYTIYLASTLGVSDFGLYSFALAYFSLIASAADFGFNRFLIREVAINRNEVTKLLCNIVLLRLSLTAGLFAAFALSLYALDPDRLRVNITLLAVMAVLPLSVSQTLDAVFIAFERFKYSAIAALLLNISTIIFGVILVNLGFGPLGAVAALIFGQIIYTGNLLFLLHKQNVSILSGVNSKIVKDIILGSAPYGILAVLGLLYFKIDTILLGYLRGNFDTGIYNAAYKFLEAVIFIPTTVGAVLFPALSKLHDVDNKKLKQIYFGSLQAMLLISLIIVIIYFVVLPLIIRQFLVNYLPSIEAIKILSLAIPFIFLHISSSTLVLSTNKYLKQVILISIIPLVFNVVLNLKFIPHYGFLAASWITVFSDIISFTLIFVFIQKYIFKHA